jgi:hypothetical protein
MHGLVNVRLKTIFVISQLGELVGRLIVNSVLFVWTV